MVSQTLLKRAVSDEWCTPAWVLDAVRQISPIRFDLATTESNPVRASVFYTLQRPFGPETKLIGPGLVWVNPPYSRAGEWANHIINAISHQREIVALVAARTDTKWWSTLMSRKPTICFLKGRLKFLQDGVEKHPAPFPSALLYYGFDNPKFEGVFRPHGTLVKVL